MDLFDSGAGSPGDDPIEDWTGHLRGSLAFPLDYTSGAQIDGEAGLIGDAAYGTGTVHLFWGLPGQDQVGPAVGYWAFDGANWLRTGAELQGYLGDFTGYLQAGYQIGDSGDRVQVEDGGYLCGRGTWYATQDAALWVGGGYGPDSSALGFAGAELRPFEGPVSLVAEGTIGTDEQWSATAGIRYRFGETHSLKAREREWLPLPTTPCATLGVKTGTAGVITNNWVPQVE